VRTNDRSTLSTYVVLQNEIISFKLRRRPSEANFAFVHHVVKIGIGERRVQIREVFPEATRQTGFPINGYFNAELQEGLGPFQATQRGGERCNRPAMTGERYSVPAHYVAQARRTKRA
jgi:hypothetical protein